ncbi:MAG: hypothetical protein HND48_09395 [Chloroflexi bacterium]|nr:hypothetical protein [Chloroflexota bacterium]
MEKLGKAAKNILRVGIPIALIAGAIIALYNSNPAKYRSMIQSLTGQFPVDAENDLIHQLQQNYEGTRNINFFVTSAQHAPSPARLNAVDMWCVVVSPPISKFDIFQGRYDISSFLVFQTRPGGRWFALHSERENFEDVGCTNYQD